MNLYKKIILSLSCFALVIPAQTVCRADHTPLFGNVSLHKKGITVAVYGAATWLLWKVVTLATDNPWPTVHKETFFRSTFGTTLAGAFIVGTALSLFCNSERECKDGPNTPLWMTMGGLFGFFYGARLHSTYGTSEHALKQAEELSKIEAYQEDLVAAGNLLDQDESHFWNTVETTYCTRKYPLLFAISEYEKIHRRLYHIREYLEKAEKIGTSTVQRATIQNLRNETNNKLGATQKSLVAIKRNPNYNAQVQAQTQDKMAEIKRQKLNVQQQEYWRKVFQKK